MRYVALIVALGLAVACPGQQAADDRAPNIVLILADDLGWCDLSTGATSLGNGSDVYQTPAIDALARDGVAFTNAYSAGANCAPTRASLLSGQYPVRHGVYTVGGLNRAGKGATPPLRGARNRGDLRAEILTIAEALGHGGYATAHFGKYHVGGHEGGTATMPESQGFDANFGGGKAGSPRRYHAKDDGTFGDRIGDSLDAYAEAGTHLTDALTAAAIDFGDRHRDEPFFLHVGHYAVHTPIKGQGRRDLRERFAARIAEAPGVMGHRNADYAALVAGLDESVAALLQHLRTTTDAAGRPLASNTLVIFTSDNGGLAGPTRNGPLRGQKGEFHEGGVRVPLILWMPGHLPAGLVRHAPVSSIDLYPTLLAAAGLDTPEGHALDGVSLLPIATNPTSHLASRPLYWHFPGYLVGNGRDARPCTVVRRDHWKLVYTYETASATLYDLATDLGEARDVAVERPAVVASLLADMREWLKRRDAAMPTDGSTGAVVPWPVEPVTKGDGLSGSGANGDQELP